MNRQLSIGLTLASIALASSASSAFAEQKAALPLGSPIPSAMVKLKSVDGRLVSIHDVAGPKGTLVVFTCNHCPYAKAWEKRIAALANNYSNQGIGVILINANDPTAYPEDAFPEMQTRAKSLGLSVPYVVDDTSNVARAFGASVTPEAFLFAADGKLAYHGTIDDNRTDPDKVGAHYLGDALAAVAAGHAPKLAETKSLGCGIKFRAQAGKP
jgi:thiol-disulfide isomerase/thioredoxin